MALVVGSIFFAINYGDKLITGMLTASETIRALVSYCVPYCVSTWSSVMAILERDSA